MSDTKQKYPRGVQWLTCNIGMLISKQGRMYTTTDLTVILHATAPTVRAWMRGEVRPMRGQAARLAEHLDVRDRHGDYDYAGAVAVWDYPALGDRTPASIPELVHHLKYNKPRAWSQDYARDVARRLKSMDDAPEEWGTVIAQILADKRTSLIKRAEHIAAIALAINASAERQQSA